MSASRILGYDVARALAILGMIVVHFAMVLARDPEHPAWLARVVGVCDGRAAATFLVLAGAGISLRARKALELRDRAELARVRSVLLRRGVFLLAVGFLNLVIWPGDILRVYGVSFLIAAWLFAVSDRGLWGLALAFVLGFLVWFGVGDYDQHWDWTTLTYHDLWTGSGLFLNLFFNGFRSIFPWTGFLLVGLWLGRRDESSPAVRRRLALLGAAVALAAEGTSRVLVAHFTAHPSGEMDQPTIIALFGTESMPPLPLFLLAAGGTAVAVIALCLIVAARRPDGPAVCLLSATGQMAFTWYVAHILLVLGTVEALGLEHSAPLSLAVGCGLGFFAVAVALSVFWRRAGRIGPLESLMRRLAG